METKCFILSPELRLLHINSSPRGLSSFSSVVPCSIFTSLITPYNRYPCHSIYPYHVYHTSYLSNYHTAPVFPCSCHSPIIFSLHQSFFLIGLIPHSPLISIRPIVPVASHSIARYPLSSSTCYFHHLFGLRQTKITSMRCFPFVRILTSFFLFSASVCIFHPSSCFRLSSLNVLTLFIVYIGHFFRHDLPSLPNYLTLEFSLLLVLGLFTLFRHRCLF